MLMNILSHLHTFQLIFLDVLISHVVLEITCMEFKTVHTIGLQETLFTNDVFNFLKMIITFGI